MLRGTYTVAPAHAILHRGKRAGRPIPRWRAPCGPAPAGGPLTPDASSGSHAPVDRGADALGAPARTRGRHDMRGATRLGLGATVLSALATTGCGGGGAGIVFFPPPPPPSSNARLSALEVSQGIFQQS